MVMTEKVLWLVLVLLALGTTVKSQEQETILENAANEFIIGFSVNFNVSFPSLLLFVTTPETNPVTFTVTANGFNFTGTAFSNSSTEVSIPSTFQVESNSERNKGIYVKAEGKNKIVVHGLSYEMHTSDAFLALPCSNLAVEEYEYYAMIYPSEFSGYTSDVLIVGCEDNTLVTTPSNTITLNRLETYLIQSSDSTGMRVTSTKPVSFFSNIKCTNIPTNIGACDHLTEQIPSTSTWGISFYAASLLGRNSGELFRIIAAKNFTTVTVNCTTFSQVQVYNLSIAGNWQEFQIHPFSFCTIESTAPLLVTQFALGHNLDNVGDPFMMMIPPVQQYSNNYVLNVPSNFSTNYITIYVATEYYQPNRIFVDDTSQVSSSWTSVYCSNSLLCGYITRVNLTAGEHRLYHQDPHARIGVSAYGFNYYNSYGYPGGLKLISIQFQCPRIIPSSITPTGILSPSPATLWSITYDQPIRRPDSTHFIEVYRADDDHLVHRIDVTSSDVTFPRKGRTVTFKFDYSFVAGTRYYLLFQKGAVVGDIFCNQESDNITDKTFWTFTVVEPQQQSSETCAALDTLIANRNVDITGICWRNSHCTTISCLNKPSLSTTINTEITFSPCNYPISVRHIVVRTVHGFDPHDIIDKISTGNQTIQLQPLFPGTINNVLSHEITGVNYGLTESSPVEGGNEQTTTIFQPIDIPFLCPIGCPLETDPLWRIIWPNTPPYVTRIQGCPEEQNWIGNVSRYCNGNGVWSDPDVLSCTSIEFATILIEALEAFSSNNSSELLNQTANVTSRLVEATSGREISLLPSDLQTTNNLLNRVINILEDNTDVMQQSQETGPDENDVINIFNNILDENNTAGWMNLQNVVTMNGSELLLNNAERYGLVLARAVEAPRKLSRPNIALSASQFDTLSTVTDEDLSFPSSEDLVNYTSSITLILASIPTNLITEKLSNSSSVPVVHILFNNLEDFLPPSSLDSSETPDGTSAIYSLQIGEREVQSRVLLDTPINLEFTFPNFENPLSYKCAFWNFSKPIGSGGFSTDGVLTAGIKIEDNVTTVQCLSNHTTSFAVLVDVAGGLQTAPEGELKALQAVSYVGCSISIICLSLTVLFFLTQRKKLFQSVNFFVHLNLAATLLVAFVVFVFGIELGKMTAGGCLFVALLLHYMFLSAFCWMLCEGILLYLLLVVVFSKIPRQRWVFILIGYVSPIPIVVISVASRHDYYGVRNSEGILQYCWLSVEKGTIYAFVVPMLLIILINVVFLVLSLNSLLKSKKKRYSINKTDKNSNFTIAKSLFIASVILLPLLGLTWIFGILTINSNSTVFAWFFTLFNSIQGAAIFFFHVIRNEMVWSKISPRLSIISSKVFGIAGDTKLHMSEFSSVTRNSRYASRRGDRGSTFPKGGTMLKVKPTDSNETKEVNNSPIFEETKLDLGKKPDEIANDKVNNEDIKIEESEKQAKESAEQDMSINLQDEDDMVVNAVSEGTILEETTEIIAYISQENVESFDDKVAVDQKRESERVEEIQAEVKNIMEGNSTINPAVSNIKDINPTSKDDSVEGTNIEELESKGENNAEVIKSNTLDDH